MAFEHSRNIVDADKEVSVALAAGGANTPSIDLEQIIGGNIENIVAQVNVPEVPGLSDAKVLTFKLEDSADGITFAAVKPLISDTVTGAGGNGGPANDIRFRFSPAIRQYVRIAQTATATPGTLVESFDFRLLF